MSCTPLPESCRFPRWVAGALLVAACATGVTWAQSGSAPEAGPSPKINLVSESVPVASGAIPDSGIVQTGCASCGDGAGGGTLCGPGAPASGGCGSCCIPGRNYCCSDCDCNTKIGRLFCGFYHCICCPDPCYEPCWQAVADTGFFLDAARPITHMRLRYTQGWDLTNPDRAEYFFARDRTNPNQLEPGGPCARHGFGKGPNCIASSVNFQDLSLYAEAAAGGFGFFIDTPYRHVDPKTSPISGMASDQVGAFMPDPTTGVSATQIQAATDVTVPAGVAIVLPQSGAMLTRSIALPAGAVLTNGAVLPNGTIIPPNTGLPSGLQLPPGTRLPSGTVLPAGTLLPSGSILPTGTAVVPAGATVAGFSSLTRTFTLAPCCPESGFADLILGTKSLLLDCHLMQITFQFKTFLPTGNFTKGLGVGHVSLEPSLLCNLCIAKDTYLQSQFAYWIPIGGDQLYQSDIFHMHFSLNRVLCCPCPGVQLIGNVELNEWTICTGAYTDTEVLGIDPNTGNQAPLSHTGSHTFLSAGPGIRLVVCDKIDFGVGSAFALTSEHWANQELRAEFRWHY